MKNITAFRASLSLLLASAVCGFAAEGPTDDTTQSDTEKLPYLGHYVRSSVNPMEVYGYFRTMDAEFEFDGMSVDTEDSGYLGGIGFGVQLHRYVDVYSEIGGGKLDSETPGFDTYDIDVFDWNIGINFTPLKRRITPVISPEFGVMRQAGNISGFDFREWLFNYGIGGGVRWDITDRWFATAMYRVEWTQFSEASSATMYHGFLVRAGLKF